MFFFLEKTDWDAFLIIKHVFFSNTVHFFSFFESRIQVNLLRLILYLKIEMLRCKREQACIRT